LGVDRAHYSPSSPYTDSPQSIGYSATISAPHMHASASEALLPFLHPSARVLDIGSGSGYLTHVLANLIGDGDTKGTVVGVEHIPELVDLATKNMSKSPEGKKMLDTGKVRFVTGVGRKGVPEDGPFDAIHVGAAAKELHEELVAQLACPGRLFIPVEDNKGHREQWIWVVDKDEKGNVTQKRKEGVRYVPLTDRPKGASGF